MKGCFHRIGLAALLWILVVITAATAPINDHFANRIAVTGLPLRLAGDTSEATVEPGEPTEIQPGWARQLERSVWWSWTATKSGLVGIYFPLDRRRSLRLYVGDSWEGLVAVPLTLSPDGSGFRTIPTLTDWSFHAEAGVTYQIAVYDAGLFTLDVMERPSNDFFADRLRIPPSGGDAFGTTSNATFESSEPTAGSRGVWYAWTPDFTGQAILTLSGGNGSDPLEAFIGESLTNLTGVGASSSGDSVLLPLTVEAGRDYSFRVSGRRGPDRFQLLLGKPPTNDQFTEAIPLSGFSARLSGTTWGTTVEPGEPFMKHATPSTGTVWWKWLAPSNGLLRIKAGSFAYRTPYRLFTGTELSKLRLLGSKYGNAGDGYPDYYTAVRGRTYYLRVEDSHFINVEFDLYTRPINDNFDRRELLQGLSASTEGNNYLATRQGKEPLHGGHRSGHSVWWTWTAPLSGHVFASSIGSDFPNVLAAYTGESLRGLNWVADNRQAYWSGVLGFHVEAGASYQIATDGIVETDIDGKRRVTRGSIRLGLDFTSLMFASPTNGSTLVGPTNVILSLAAPLEAVDGNIASAEFYLADSFSNVQSVGTVGAAPFSLTVSNLVPGIHVCGAVVTNHLGQTRGVPPVPFVIRPANDAFAESAPLDPIPGSVRGWVAGASWERGEKRPPYAVPNAGSSWWVWTAPETGQFRMRVNTATSLVLYKGKALGMLKRAATFGYGESAFQAIGGETYYLQAYSPAASPSQVASQVEFVLTQ
jgi:hypothetical protein